MEYLFFTDSCMHIDAVSFLTLQLLQGDHDGCLLVFTLGYLGSIVRQLPGHLFNLPLIVGQHAVELVLFFLTLDL